MNWYKVAKFVSPESDICGYCYKPLTPIQVALNTKHVYPIGILFVCRCSKSKLWTNSIRNEKNLLAFFAGQPNTWGEQGYTNGFCNDRFCGYCFQPVMPLENGFHVPMLGETFDRFGCKTCQVNQQILNDAYKEYPAGITEPILQWYKAHQQHVQSFADSRR